MNIKVGNGPFYKVNEVDDVVGQILLDGQWREMPYEEMWDLVKAVDQENGVEDDD